MASRLLDNGVGRGVHKLSITFKCQQGDGCIQPVVFIEFQVSLDDHPDLFGRAVNVVGDIGDSFNLPAGVKIWNRKKDFLLGGKIFIQGRLGNLGRFTNGRDGRVLKSLFPENLEGALDDVHLLLKILLFSFMGRFACRSIFVHCPTSPG